MVAKVKDSVDSKTKLDEFEKEIADISSRLIRLRDGDLSIELRTDLAAARGLTESVNFIAANLRQLTDWIYENSKVTKNSTVVIQNSLSNVISDDDARAGRTKLVVSSLAEMPDRLRQVSDEIAEGFERAGTIRKLAEDRKGFAGSLSADIAAIRGKLNDALRYIEILREHSAILPNFTRQATDISRRSNMIAINLSAKTSGANGNGRISLAAEEIAALSKKTANIATAAESAGTSLYRELDALEEFIESLKTDLGSLADTAIAESENHNELEIGLDRLFELRERLPKLLPELDSEHETSLAFLEHSAGSVGSHLRETEEEIAKIERLSSDLMASVEHFRHINSASGGLDRRRRAEETGLFTNIGLEKNPVDSPVNEYDQK
jgi:methyl-accepting chemotaxis protein